MFAPSVIPQANNQRPSFWSSDEWATPPTFVQKLEQEFGPFDLDVCCRVETAKAPKFYTKLEDGLRSPWFGRVWLNPPYSHPTPWLRRAAEQTATGSCDLVVALLPARTETRWFHDIVLATHAEVRFVRGRLRFHGWEGTPIPAPRNPSFLAIWRHDRLTDR